MCMPRIARVIAPGLPHHITQRGARRLPTFFCEDDYQLYINILSKWCTNWNVDIWAYCFMPNHIHIIAVPYSEESLARAIGETHRRYTLLINEREGWKGHLWQERFSSFIMDERHLYFGVRYVELNPVRANLVKCPWEYPWSSANAHLAGKDNCLVKVQPLLDMYGDWKKLLEEGLSTQQIEQFRKHMRTGRPLGSEEFMADLEELLGRELRPRKPGPKKT